MSFTRPRALWRRTHTIVRTGFTGRHWSAIQILSRLPLRSFIVGCRGTGSSLRWRRRIRESKVDRRSHFSTRCRNRQKHTLPVAYFFTGVIANTTTRWWNSIAR